MGLVKGYLDSVAESKTQALKKWLQTGCIIFLPQISLISIYKERWDGKEELQQSQAGMEPSMPTPDDGSWRRDQAASESA